MRPSALFVTWPIYKNCFSFHMHIPESACIVNKVRQFLQLTPLNFKTSARQKWHHQPQTQILLSPRGPGKGKRWDGGRRKKVEVGDRRFKVSWWRGGVIGLQLRQVCFSHKHTQLFSFRSGGGGGVKNDKARLWSHHDKALLQLQFPQSWIKVWILCIRDIYALQTVIEKLITYCKLGGTSLTYMTFSVSAT